MPLKRLLARPRFKVPANLLGADLFWWRESPDLHTLVTIQPPELTAEPIEGLTITFALFDTDGVPRARWNQPLRPGHPVCVDSARVHAEIPGAASVPDGVLAAFVSCEGRRSEDLRERYTRLYSMVDWYSADGEIVSLHSDQTIVVDDDEPIEFTEIIFRETVDERTYLVLLNGHEHQEAGSVTLEAMNHRGETRQAIYLEPMEPYTVHRIELAELLPTLVAFCDGEHATLTGVFNCRGLFTRPYVITERARLSGYHGGDRYDWEGLPAVRYEHLGRGHVNPMVVLHSDDVRTYVNIFNSHGHLEEDFRVDARVYDESGALVVEREAWLAAPRHGLGRGAIADLLPAGLDRLVGYVALTFAPEDVPLYPATLQALMEYRTAHGAARVMAWADEWNSPERLARARVPLRAFYRVPPHPDLTAWLSVTNCGLTHAYRIHAPYTVLLTNTKGETQRWEGTLAPHATMFVPVERLFPDARDFLGGETGTAIVESIHDLAIVMATRHERSGVLAVEHAMALGSHDDGRQVLPCGN